MYATSIKILNRPISFFTKKKDGPAFRLMETGVGRFTMRIMTRNYIPKVVKVVEFIFPALYP